MCPKSHWPVTGDGHSNCLPFGTRVGKHVLASNAVRDLQGMQSSFDRALQMRKVEVCVDTGGLASSPVVWLELLRWDGVEMHADL